KDSCKVLTAACSKWSRSPGEGTWPTRFPRKSACIAGPVPPPGGFFNGRLGRVDGAGREMSQRWSGFAIQEIGTVSSAWMPRTRNFSRRASGQVRKRGNDADIMASIYASQIVTGKFAAVAD